MIAPAQPLLADFTARVYFPLTLPAESTRDDYGYVVDVYSRWCANASDPVIPDTPGAATPEGLGEYFCWLMANGGSPQTARKHRRVLRAILRLAKRRGFCPTLDLDEIPLPKVTKRKPVAWTQQEFEKLVAACKTLDGKIGPWRACYWFKALLLTVYSTDWRIGAVMRLKTGDVTLDDGFAKSIETKTREERTASLIPQCVDAISAIWSPNREEVFGDWPFDRGCRQWQALQNRFKLVIDAAGVRDIGRFHSIRKTSTTHVAKIAGRDAARQHAGHGDVRVTNTFYIDDTQLNETTPAHHLGRLQIHDDRQLRLW